MKNTRLKIALSIICLFAFSLSAFAAPVRFNQVVQTVDAKPGKAKTGGFAQLHLSDDDTVKTADEDGDDPTQQEKRVIVTKTTDITEAEECDCINIPPGGTSTKFPKWALLGLGAIPVALVLLNRNKDKATPTPSTSPSGSPGTTPTPTTPTPTVTPTVTPTPTITPTPEPVPEPMTMLLFGTGLAGIGVGARRRLRKNADKETK